MTVFQGSFAATDRTRNPEEQFAEIRQKVVDSLHQTLDSTKHGELFPTFLVEAVENEVWKHPRRLTHNTVPPMDVRDFVRKPYPVGLGTTVEIIERLIAGNERAMLAWKRALPGGAVLQLPTPEEAARNSRTYAVRNVSEALRSGGHGVDSLPHTLLHAIELKAWEAFETPMGNIYRNTTMVQWITSKPPQGLGSSIDRVRQLLTATERAEAALVAFDKEMQVAPGGAHNLTGRNQHTPKVAGEGEVKLNNVKDDQPEYPMGNTAQYGIRRLRKAAEAGDQAASHLLAQVVDETSKMSVHRACVEMGWRKAPDPLRVMQAAWTNASQGQRQAMLAWLSEQATVAGGGKA
jgi:hypothetical protein